MNEYDVKKWWWPFIDKNEDLRNWALVCWEGNEVLKEHWRELY